MKWFFGVVYFCMHLHNSSLSLFQIRWPSTALKIEECIMKGKDAVSITHCKLNTLPIIFLVSHEGLTL